jgi:hypothetical protein
LEFEKRNKKVNFIVRASPSFTPQKLRLVFCFSLFCFLLVLAQLLKMNEKTSPSPEKVPFFGD